MKIKRNILLGCVVVLAIILTLSLSACSMDFLESIHTHQYNEGVVMTPATCDQEGTKKYNCIIANCNHSYTDSYSLTPFTATEIFNQSVKYVGEIVVYDRQGAELGLGTCFVYTSDGKIITNYHVIDGAYSAKVTIESITYNVQSVLAYDEDIDLAILQINATNLTAAPLCMKPVQAGETVYAIGSSRGLTNTYSQGIVTYADRVIDRVSYVQHDASITHGNSGGPLINVYGEVIGINTWGISDSQNLNFAVFADELSNLVYGSPVSLSDFYVQKYSPYDVLMNWALNNFTYSSKEGDYYLYEDEYDDGSAYGISYDPINGNLVTDVMWHFEDGASLYLGMNFTKGSTEHRYYAHYSDDVNDNYTRGWIYANTFNPNTTLTYTSYDGDYWNKSVLINLYSTAMVDLLEWFEWCLEDREIGISIEDFGFTAFSDSQGASSGNSGTSGGGNSGTSGGGNSNAYSQYQAELELLTEKYNAATNELWDKIADCQTKIENCQKAINNAQSQLASLSPICPEWFAREYTNNWQAYGSSAAASAAAQSAWTQEYNSKRNQLNNTISANRTAMSGHQTNISLYSTQLDTLATQYKAEVNALKAKYGIS